MKTIAVVSTCQSVGLSDALRVLLPDCALTCYDMSVLDTATFARDSLDGLRAFDLVVASDFADDFGPIALSNVRRFARRLLVVPSVIFWGFHPDLTYLPARFAHISSPLHAYHSIIALAGFVTGRSVAETVALFNAMVYGRLGFFAAYARELDGIAPPFSEHGIDIAPCLARWRARGCFMHSPNHPDRDVLHDVARAALASAGIAMAEDADLSALPDTLAPLPCFPIYPELAAPLGLEGSMLFKPRDPPGRVAAPVPLDEFVAASFDAYAPVPKAVLREAIGVERALRDLAR